MAGDSAFSHGTVRQIVALEEWNASRFHPR